MSDEWILQIRPETGADLKMIRQVNDEAFGQTTEGGIVEKVRQSAGFVAELSLVAQYGAEIVGHALFSKVAIETETEPVEILALGPIAVRPKFQRRGAGGQLIREGIRRSIALGFRAVVLVGHPTYYPRFGFVPGGRFGLKCSFSVPDEVFMVLPLGDGVLDGIAGTVVYPAAFSEEL